MKLYHLTQSFHGSFMGLKSTVFYLLILTSSPQAAKSLIYFFAEDKSAIYIVIAFSIFSPINTQPLRSSMTKVVGQGDNSKPIKLMLITNLSICRSFHSHSLKRKYCFSKCGKLSSYFYFNFQAHFLFHFQKL